MFTFSLFLKSLWHLFENFCYVFQVGLQLFGDRLLSCRWSMQLTCGQKWFPRCWGWEMLNFWATIWSPAITCRSPRAIKVNAVTVQPTDSCWLGFYPCVGQQFSRSAEPDIRLDLFTLFVVIVSILMQLSDT